MSTESIRIVVTADGAKAVARDIEGIGKSAEQASGGVDKLGGLLKAVAAAAAVRETIRIADAYTELTNRIRTVTRSEEELNSVRSELFRISNASRASVSDLSTVYTRLALTTKNLGLSQREVLDLTESLQQATVLSGASATQASAALVQLAQGMGSGALRGDELNSVLENTPVIAQTIADHLKVTIGDLRRMGAEGKITGKDIAEAFAAARESLAERFGKSVPTVSQAMTVLNNTIMNVIGQIDSAAGSTAGLSQAIIELAQESERLIPTLVTIADVFTEVDSFRGIWGDLAPNADAVGMLQSFAVGLALVRDLAGNTFSSLVDMAQIATSLGTGNLAGARTGLNNLMTPRGAPTADALVARFSERRGVTTVDGRDPLGVKPKATPGAGAAEKGPTFERIMEGLRTEHELLKMNTREQEVGKELLEIREKLQKKLREGQLTELATQIRANQELKVANDISEAMGKRMSEQLDASQVARNKKHQEISDALSERMSRNMNASAENGGMRDRGFAATTELMRQEQLSQLQTTGEQLAAIFGPGGTLEKGLGNIGSSMADIIGHAIAFGDSWADIEQAVERLGRTIVAEVISSLIKTSVQMGINAALGQSLTAATVGTSVASAAAVGAAWATPAAFASVATLGGAGAAGTAGLSGAVAAAKGMQIASLVGFEEGGYTGAGYRKGVAGVVHNDEFVLNSRATHAMGVANLEAINAGRAPAGGGKPMRVTIINQAPGVEFESRQIDDSHIELVARRVVAATAPEVIANDMRSAYGKTNKAMRAAGRSSR